MGGAEDKADTAELFDIGDADVAAFEIGVAKPQAIGAERGRAHAWRIGEHIAAPDPFPLLKIIKRRREVADDSTVVRHNPRLYGRNRSFGALASPVTRERCGT